MWLQSGKRFMSALPAVANYCPDFDRSTPQGDAAASMAVLREVHQLLELISANALISAPVKDAKLDKPWPRSP
jgi:hypothetical protein